jgi:hypothetical protein
MLPWAPGVLCPALGASNLGRDFEDTTMSLHIRQAPSPRLSVRGALLWIAVICLIMGLAVAFGNDAPPPV